MEVFIRLRLFPQGFINPCGTSKRGDENMKKTMTLILISALILGLTGCMSLPVGVSDSTKPLNQGGYTELGRTGKGHAVGVIVMGIPVSEPYPCKSATKRAIANGGGDALVCVTSDYTQIMLPFVSFIISTVQGTAVQSK